MFNYQTLFLSWFNDFLTIECFAEYYNMPVKRARIILNKGYVIHESQFGSVS